MDDSSKNSFFNKTYKPAYQALATFVAVVAVILGSKLIKFTGIIEVSDRFPWMTAAAFLLFFAMINSVFFLTTKNTLKYWGQSIYSYLGLAFASGMCAYLFSSLSINEAGSYRWIFMVLTFGYLVFLSIISMMRKIVEFAEKEEWHHPRIRNRKKRTNKNQDYD